MTAPIYCKTPNAAVNCQQCKHVAPLHIDPKARTFDPRARAGRCNYFVQRIDYGVRK